MLNDSCESEHLYFVLDHKGSAFSLSPWSMMLAVGFKILFYIYLLFLQYCATCGVLVP